MKKPIVLLVLVGAAIAAVWWWRKPTGAGEPDEASATAQVSVAPLRNQSIGRQLVAYGSVESSDQGIHAVTLSYDCIVRTVTATAGSRVAEGSPLLSVEPTPDARLQLDSARSVAALAGRSLISSRQRFDLKLGTRDDLRAAEQASEDANLKVESLERRGVGDSGQTLLSPSEGIVVKFNAVPGATVSAGNVLVTVANAGSLRARLGIEPSDAGMIKAGQKVTLASVSRPGAVPVSGTVGSIDAIADPGTGSIDIRVPLAPGNEWFTGERVEGQIEVERKTALVAPASAVLPEDGKDVLYTVKNGKAVKHVVITGIRAGDQIEISGADLTAGDSVVILGNYELTDGMDVSLSDRDSRGETPVPEEKRR